MGKIKYFQGWWERVRKERKGRERTISPERKGEGWDSEPWDQGQRRRDTSPTIRQVGILKGSYGRRLDRDVSASCVVGRVGNHECSVTSSCLSLLRSQNILPAWHRRQGQGSELITSRDVGTTHKRSNNDRGAQGGLEPWGKEANARNSELKKQGAGLHVLKSLLSCPQISGASHWLSQRQRSPGKADLEVGVHGHRAGQRRVENEWGRSWGGDKWGNNQHSHYLAIVNNWYLRINPRMNVGDRTIFLMVKMAIYDIISSDGNGIANFICQLSQAMVPSCLV